MYVKPAILRSFLVSSSLVALLLMTHKTVAFASSVVPIRTTRCAPVCCAHRSPSYAPAREATVREVRAFLLQLHRHQIQLQNTGQVTQQLRQFLSDFGAYLRRHDAEVPQLEHASSAEAVLKLIRPDGDLAGKALQVIREPKTPPSMPLHGNSAAETAARVLLEEQRQKRSGFMSRRNAYWMAIPIRYARAHEFVSALPAVASRQFVDADSLRRLRQESEAFHVASCLSYIRAADAWAFLGLAERVGAHELSLQVWKRTVCAQVRKRTFVERYQLARRANALLMYAEMCREEWDAVRGKTPSSAHAVRLFEGGMHVGAGEFRGFVASPAAGVWERSEKDYWMWQSDVNKILLVHALPAFRTSVQPYCRCEPIAAPSRLPARAFVEVQFAMACSGKQYADVLYYGTLQTSRVFRVARSEPFLDAALEMTRWFERQFILRKTPPESNFQRRYAAFATVWRLVDEGVTRATTVAEVSAMKTETWLAPWRSRLNDWEVAHSSLPFRSNLA